MKTTIRVNGVQHSLEIDPSTPLLWALREQLALTGTKFGCGIAQCGACTVLVDGQATRACITPLASVEGREVVTIEGLAPGAETLHPLQEAWVEHQVPQCGYCQSGQLMSAAALIANNPAPTDADIDVAMQGNICRCGMYDRIRRAIKTAAAASAPEAEPHASDAAKEVDHG